MDKKEAFIAAISKNEGSIFKIASVYTSNREDTSDLVQEIIYQLWKSYDSFEQRSSLSTWIYRVALNVATYYNKASRKRVQTLPLGDLALDRQESFDPDWEERWQLFQEQIEKLNLLDKGIILLYLEEKSHAEIADITGISTSNVGTKLARIKEKLRTQLIKQL